MEVSSTSFHRQSFVKWIHAKIQEYEQEPPPLTQPHQQAIQMNIDVRTVMNSKRAAAFDSSSTVETRVHNQIS